MLMSFLGSLGNLMKGSGLQELFEEVYSPNSVVHIMSGKQYARALRAHILANSALNTLLLEDIHINNHHTTTFQDLYNKAMSRELSLSEIESAMSSDEFSSICTSIEETKTSLRKNSRTSMLWLSYMEYVETAKEFIAAERMSDWDLHLFTCSKMLNLFAATGHSNYAKSVRIYLQEMNKLQESDPVLYQFFQKGHHTVKRSEKNWNAVWSDMGIEQTMMRSIKTRGGLVGRGMTESVRHLWVLSMSTSARVHDTFLELTGTNNISSDQHVELGTSRMKSDYDDCSKFVSWLRPRHPFKIKDRNLHSLSTGIVSITGKDDVSSEKAEEIGKSIQNSFDNTPYSKCSVRRKDTIKPLSTLHSVAKVKNPLCERRSLVCPLSSCG